MAIQDSFGKIGFFEDFNTIPDDGGITIADADGLRHNDVLLIAVSGDVAADAVVDEPNGVWSFSGAGAAADGIAMLSAPMRPDRNGTIVVGGRLKASTAADFRFFGGWASTADRDETVNPFTLSGTTLTANNAGEAVGWYFDSQATTDDLRFMSSSSGTADTTAAVFNHLTGQNTTLGTLGVRANATLTADKYFVWKIEMDPDGTVRAFIGDDTMGNSKGLTQVATLKAGAMSASSLYFPLMMAVAQSTGDPTAEVDYFYAKGNRYWGQV